MADEDSPSADATPVGSEASPPRANGGGAPTDAMPHTRWQKFRLVGLVILKRVRFIAVLAAVGLFIGYWDTVMNYWDKWTQPRSVASRELEPGQEFYCPMDPQVVRSTYEPNGDVPKCPDLRHAAVAAQERGSGQAAGGHHRPGATLARAHPTGGHQDRAVEYRPMAKQTKTVGYVAFDESRLSQDRQPGGRLRGEALRGRDLHRGPQGRPAGRDLQPGTVQHGAGTCPGDAERRSRPTWPPPPGTSCCCLGVSQQEIDGIVASGKPSPRLVIRSPQTGYVVDKKIVVGASVEAKMTLLEVADLSTVWVEADVYEKDIPFLQVGQKVEATVEACPQSHVHREARPDLSATGNRHADQPHSLRAGQPAA